MTIIKIDKFITYIRTQSYTKMSNNDAVHKNIIINIILIEINSIPNRQFSLNQMNDINSVHGSMRTYR